MILLGIFFGGLGVWTTLSHLRNRAVEKREEQYNQRIGEAIRSGELQSVVAFLSNFEIKKEIELRFHKSYTMRECTIAAYAQVGGIGSKIFNSSPYRLWRAEDIDPSFLFKQAICILAKGEGMKPVLGAITGQLGYFPSAPRPDENTEWLSEIAEASCKTTIELSYLDLDLTILDNDQVAVKIQKAQDKKAAANAIRECADEAGLQEIGLPNDQKDADLLFKDPIATYAALKKAIILPKTTYQSCLRQ